jgi:HEAT repeat protein
MEADMPGQRVRILGVLGGVAALAAVAFGLWTGLGSHGKRSNRPVVRVNADSPLALIAQQIEKGDFRALTAIANKLDAIHDGPPVGVDETEGKDWITVLKAIRGNYARFGDGTRGAAASLSARILDRFAADPAPAIWIEALTPVHDIILAALSDRALKARVPALIEVKRFWNWQPGRSMDTREELILGDWKETFYLSVIDCMANADPKVRASAIACLGELPIDKAAANAAPYVNDPDPLVRAQTIVAFAKRPQVLPEDDIIPLIYDVNPDVASKAIEVLKIRGLTNEQIGMCRMIAHPKADIRLSAIPMLAGRVDVDPIVWLIRLSRDTDESVRLKAIEALGARKEIEARDRLAEIASADRSKVVREAAAKLMVGDDDQTASLPPLPDSSGLKPKAN